MIKQCDPGSYCPKGALTETLCPTGTYNPVAAQRDCFACPKGKWCDVAGLVNPNDCPQGYYCEVGVAGTDNRKQCPTGSYANEINLGDIEQCLPCPPGFYCPLATSVPSLVCAAGFYCAINAVAPSDASITHQIGSDINGKCPKGFYCPLGTALLPTVAPLPCPIGTYSDTE